MGTESELNRSHLPKSASRRTGFLTYAEDYGATGNAFNGPSWLWLDGSRRCGA
jgi:hypothetical protein